MNERARGSTTPRRPGWAALYALAGLMLGVLLLAQGLVAAGAERTVLECGLVFSGFAAMAHWTRRNRAALDHLDWCACASSQVTVRVIPSRRDEPARTRREDAWKPREVEPIALEPLARR